jgi:hypothetical protein
MSITIVVICFRLLKTSQILMPTFGSWVQTLYFSSGHIISWLFFYAVIWLSFSFPFWMLYGGPQFPSNGYSNICTDVTATDYNLANNCTTITVSGFQNYSTMIYWLYRLTFGLTLDDVIIYFEVFLF